MARFLPPTPHNGQMANKRHLLLAGLPVVALGGSIWLVWPREPVYHGKTLERVVARV